MSSNVLALEEPHQTIAKLYDLHEAWTIQYVQQPDGSDLWYAYRDKHADQRANDFNELARRCAWEQRYKARLN